MNSLTIERKNDMFNTLKKISTAFAFALVLVCLWNTPTKAYVEDQTYVDEEGLWEVSDADNPRIEQVPVAMYMLVSPEYVDKGFRKSYMFWCTEGEFEWSDGHVTNDEGLLFWFRSDNARCIEVVDGMEIWYWEFNIEPGKYIFSFPEGDNDISVLTQSLGSPFVRDGYTEEEETVVNPGEPVILFSMFGPWEWRSELATLKSFLPFVERKYAELKGEEYVSAPTTTITVEQEEVPTEEAPVLEAEEMEEEQTMETTEEPVQEISPVMNLMKKIAATLVCIFVVGGLWLASTPKKEE